MLLRKQQCSSWNAQKLRSARSHAYAELIRVGSQTYKHDACALQKGHTCSWQDGELGCQECAQASANNVLHPRVTLNDYTVSDIHVPLNKNSCCKERTLFRLGCACCGTLIACNKIKTQCLFNMHLCNFQWVRHMLDNAFSGIGSTCRAH